MNDENGRSRSGLEPRHAPKVKPVEVRSMKLLPGPGKVIPADPTISPAPVPPEDSFVSAARAPVPAALSIVYILPEDVLPEHSFV